MDKINATGCTFSIQSNLNTKDGVKSLLLNEILEQFWIRPKDKEEAYNEVSDLYMTVRRGASGVTIFHRTIFRRTRNGKRFVWTFSKKEGRIGGYVAKRLIHKFSKPAEQQEPTLKAWKEKIFSIETLKDEVIEFPDE